MALGTRAGPSILSQVLASMLVSCCRHVTGSEPLRACELDQVSPFHDNTETASGNWQTRITTGLLKPFSSVNMKPA